jgi:hypothetical protein
MFQHEGDDVPSMIKIAPYGRKFAYAASKRSILCHVNQKK